MKSNFYVKRYLKKAHFKDYEKIIEHFVNYSLYNYKRNKRIYKGWVWNCIALAQLQKFVPHLTIKQLRLRIDDLINSGLLHKEHLLNLNFKNRLSYCIKDQGLLVNEIFPRILKRAKYSKSQAKNRIKHNKDYKTKVQTAKKNDRQHYGIPPNHELYNTPYISNKYCKRANSYSKLKSNLSILKNTCIKTYDASSKHKQKEPEKPPDKKVLEYLKSLGLGFFPKIVRKWASLHSISYLKRIVEYAIKMAPKNIGGYIYSLIELLKVDIIPENKQTEENKGIFERLISQTKYFQTTSVQVFKNYALVTYHNISTEIPFLDISSADFVTMLRSKLRPYQRF